MFDENSLKTCRIGDGQNEKHEATSLSMCKRKCDDDANCRFMRYSKVDNWCYTFVRCDQHEDAPAGITYYKEGYVKIIHLHIFDIISFL